MNYPRAGVLLALPIALACGEEDAPDASPEVTPDVQAIPRGQSFDRRLEIRLEATEGSEVFYTVDGSSPNGSDALVYQRDEPVVLETTALVSFVAKLGARWSSRGSELYSLLEPVEPFRPPARGLEVSDDVFFFTADPGDTVLEDRLVLRSVGLAAVRLDAIYVASQGAFFEPGVFEVDPPEVVFLSPGEELSLTVRYNVRSTLRTAALILETNDLRAPNGRWVITLGGRLATW